MNESTDKPTRRRSLTLPLIMIVFSLVITIPSIFWMLVTLHPFMSEIYPHLPNLGKAELLLDHIDRYTNPLANPLTNSQIFIDSDTGAFVEPKAIELVEPFNRFVYQVNGLEVDNSISINRDLGSFQAPFREWLSNKADRNNNGQLRIQEDSQLFIVRAKSRIDTILFSGALIDMDKYRSTLGELVDLAITNTVFDHYLTSTNHSTTSNESELTTPFYLEVNTGNNILFSKGINDSEHSTEYARRELTLLNDVDIILSAPLNIEFMIRRAVGNIKKTSIFAAILFFFGFVILIRRQKENAK